MATQSNEQINSESRDELSIWLRDGWKIMLKHFPALVLIALVADVPLALIANASDSIENGLLAVLVSLSSIAIITPLAKAAAIIAIDKWERGEPSATVGAFVALLRNIHVLLAASILWCIGVFVGVGLLIIPGILVLILGQCLMGAIVLEGLPIKEAIQRSRFLLKSRFWNVLALFCMVQAVAGIASGVLEAILGTLIYGLPLEIITRVLTSPIAFAPLAVMFLRTSRASGR
jgi:hypothetical protein